VVRGSPCLRTLVPVLVLAVDTATPAVTAAVVELHADLQSRAEVVAARVSVDARRHGELLGPAIQAVLAEAGVAPRGLLAVVAGTGPGPYTGLRVGLVTAAAFADATGLPLYGVCSLDAIAAGTEPMLVATDARRREVYWATYTASGARRIGPAVHRPDDLARRLPDLHVSVMAGAGAELYRDVLGLPLAPPRYPDPAALARLAGNRVRGGAPSEPPTPRYLRRPDAEQARAAKPVLQG
jgi:tRNA threonylcarbamoyl adenosine modification protein YeaZ